MKKTLKMLKDEVRIKAKTEGLNIEYNTPIEDCIAEIEKGSEMQQINALSGILCGQKYCIYDKLNNNDVLHRLKNAKSDDERRIYISILLDNADVNCEDFKSELLKHTNLLKEIRGVNNSVE